MESCLPDVHRWYELLGRTKYAAFVSRSCEFKAVGRNADLAIDGGRDHRREPVDQTGEAANLGPTPGWGSPRPIPGYGSH